MYWVKGQYRNCNKLHLGMFIKIRYNCCKHQNSKDIYLGLFRAIQNLNFSNFERQHSLWLPVGYQLQISKIGPAQTDNWSKANIVTFWSAMCKPNILTTVKVSVAFLDYSTYKNTNLSEHIDRNWLFLNNVKNVKFVSFLSYEWF